MDTVCDANAYLVSSLFGPYVETMLLNHTYEVRAGRTLHVVGSARNLAGGLYATVYEDLQTYVAAVADTIHLAARGERYSLGEIGYDLAMARNTPVSRAYWTPSYVDAQVGTILSEQAQVLGAKTWLRLDGSDLVVVGEEG